MEKLFINNLQYNFNDKMYTLNCKKNIFYWCLESDFEQKLCRQFLYFINYWHYWLTDRIYENKASLNSI